MCRLLANAMHCCAEFCAGLLGLTGSSLVPIDADQHATAQLLCHARDRCASLGVPLSDELSDIHAPQCMVADR